MDHMTTSQHNFSRCHNNDYIIKVTFIFSFVDGGRGTRYRGKSYDTVATIDEGSIKFVNRQYSLFSLSEVVSFFYNAMNYHVIKHGCRSQPTAILLQPLACCFGCPAH